MDFCHFYSRVAESCSSDLKESVVLINSHEAGCQDADVVRSGETAGREKMEAPGPSVPA